MSRTVTVRLAAPAHEMAQEEILKQVAHLSKRISGARFVEGGSLLLFETGEEDADEQSARVEALARKVQRSLRSLERKLVYRTTAAEHPRFRGTGMAPGISMLGNGQAALEGVPLWLFRYLDRRCEALGAHWDARPLLTPTLIPAATLARCDYFRSFPHNVTFAAHLFEDSDRIEAFRERHQERESLDDDALADMETPEACLSPAVCYHAYHLNQDRTLPAEGLVYDVCGKCFRYESSNMRDLRRLWDFTMREIVFLGAKEDVLARRETGIELVSRLLEELDLPAEIRTASDPFFIAPDAQAKTYFQLSAETKYEVSLMLPDEARLAVGSLNYHTDFFGRAFNISVEGAGPMHSVCVAFGLERFLYAFLCRHGNDPALWPQPVAETFA